VDAVEREFGDGRTPSLCRPAAGWGADDGYTYDSNFRIASHTVNGGNAINFIYDNDNLLTNAGTLSLTRSAQNGLITATTLGGVTDTLTSKFVVCPRDGLGRAERSEPGL
jgi:hypothetical protein